METVNECLEIAANAVDLCAVFHCRKLSYYPIQSLPSGFDPKNAKSVRHFSHNLNTNIADFIKNKRTIKSNSFDSYGNVCFRKFSSAFDSNN